MTEWISPLQKSDYLSIKKLLKNGADVNDQNEHDESVLALAIKSKCDQEVIDLLIENGADMYDFDEEGVSIFDYAITYNNINLFNRFIEEGININETKRRSGFTPLMAAVCYARFEMAKTLLIKGADKTKRDNKGFNAGDFARKMRKDSMMELLK